LIFAFGFALEREKRTNSPIAHDSTIGGKRHLCRRTAPGPLVELRACRPLPLTKSKAILVGTTGIIVDAQPIVAPWSCLNDVHVDL